VGKPFNSRPSSPDKRISGRVLKLEDTKPHLRGGKKSRRRVVSKRWVKP
jgi:hypothetical protein